MAFTGYFENKMNHNREAFFLGYLFLFCLRGHPLFKTTLGSSKPSSGLNSSAIDIIPHTETKMP